ncbi:MAG: response regulator [Acidobacteriota bacterium]
MGHGTRLGLSSVYGIVKQSGGNIWVYSEPGHGTTFKVYVPAVDADEADEPREAASRRPRRKEPAVPRGTGTVLVVEDDASLRKLVVAALGSAGYTVLQAGDGNEALRVSEEHDGRIDLLLTDVVLPGLDGPRIAETLRERRPGIRVVFMSGYTDDAIVQRGALEKGTALLDKPLRLATLLEKVRDMLSPSDEA